MGSSSSSEEEKHKPKSSDQIVRDTFNKHSVTYSNLRNSQTNSKVVNNRTSSMSNLNRNIGSAYNSPSTTTSNSQTNSIGVSDRESSAYNLNKNIGSACNSQSTTTLNSQTNFPSTTTSNSQTNATVFSNRRSVGNLKKNTDPACSSASTVAEISENVIPTEDRMASCHDTFLKKILSQFNFKNQSLGERRWKGHYCYICDKFEIYRGKHEFHGKSEEHKKKLAMNAPGYDLAKVRLYECEICRIHFYGFFSLLTLHINSDWHDHISSLFKRKLVGSGRKTFEKKISLSNDVSNENESDVILPSSVVDKFYKRLYHKGDTYSYFCYNCKLWISEEFSELWDEHETGCQNKRMTQMKCVDCKVISVGSDKWNQFHSSAEWHDKFKQFLVNEKFKGMSDEYVFTVDENKILDDNGNNDGSVTTDEVKTFALLIEELPRVNSKILFDYFKDFGFINGKIEMRCNGANTAKINFKHRATAVNIVENETPISINGQKVKVSLVEV